MPKKNVVVITGITGQDGAHLAKYLLEKNMKVYGTFRRGTHNKIWRLEELGIVDQLSFIEIDLDEPLGLVKALSNIMPDFIYHLAGVSFVSDSFNHPAVSIRVNTLGALNLLEATKIACPEAKLFFASSSEIYGASEFDKIIDENTVPDPGNPYGISKLAMQHLVKLYRDVYGLKSFSGIMFNHESSLRSRQFVTRKITYNIARLKLQGGGSFFLGNLDASRDWGAAHDYVRGMDALLNSNNPTDVVFATGTLTTVRQFLRMACEAAGFEVGFFGQGLNEICIDKKTNKEIARVSKKYFRPNDNKNLMGSSKKLQTIAGWENSISVETLVEMMVKDDFDRIKQGKIDV